MKNTDGTAGWWVADCNVRRIASQLEVKKNETHEKPRNWEFGSIK